MTDVGEALNPLWGQKGMIGLPSSHQLVALHNALHVGELPDVDHNPRHVAADEGDDDAEENQKQVQLSTPAPLRTKSWKEKRIIYSVI